MAGGEFAGTDAGQNFVGGLLRERGAFANHEENTLVVSRLTTSGFILKLIERMSRGSRAGSARYNHRMARRALHWSLAFLILFSAIGVAGSAVVLAGLRATYADRWSATLDDLPHMDAPRVAIVFGAGLTRSGEPTPALYDRVATAAELYQRGLVTRLLLTGDNRFADYNEPEAMRRTALRLGVPADALVLDYAGRRTYDSCYRAHEIFGVNHAILVTQAFHLERALYLCQTFGIDSWGLAADRRDYSYGAQTWWSAREAAATLLAWLDVNVIKPMPVLGEKIPIGN